MSDSIKQAQSIVGYSLGRPKNDFYPTPEYVTEAILKKEFYRGEIWECACGEGHISRVLLKHNYSVLSTDLIDRGYGVGGIDFLNTEVLECPNVFTNPPFKLAEKFVEHAVYDLQCESLTLFAKLAFLEGYNRTKLLMKTPLKNIYVFRKRVTLTRNGERLRNSGMIAFAWYVWRKDYSGKPMVDWI